MKVRPYHSSDAEAICDIYNHYITHTTITFELKTLTAETMNTRFQSYAQICPAVVAEVEGEVVGYAYASPYRHRRAYQHSVETTVYLKHDQGGRGYGRLLYESLLESLQQKDIHTVIAGIALPNEASVRLHQRLGFKKVAHFAQVGRKFDQWIDVGFWQLFLKLDAP